MANDTDYLKDLGPLNELQYASKDFPSYFDALLRRIREQYGADYNDFGQSSTGMLLTHITAYGLSQLSWYLDRSANDCFLETARTLSTVTKLARQIGYKPNPATSSTVDLSLTFAATAAPSVISQGFQFSGPSNLVFTATSSVVVPAGNTSATVNVSEGSPKTVNFTGTGEANQTYTLNGVPTDKFLADTSVRVFVNGLEWTEQDFITFEATNQFDVSYTTAPPVVTFGDGFAGNIPPLGSAIQVKYRVISGAAGNVQSGTITSAIDTFLVAGNPVTLTVNNAQGSSGGADPETVEKIKINAPRYYLSRGAAITQDDYIALTEGFSDPTYGSVSVAYADVIRDQSVDATTQAILDAIAVAITQFGSIFGADKAQIEAQIANLNSAAATIVAQTTAALSASLSASTSNLTMQTLVDTGNGANSNSAGAFANIADQCAIGLAATTTAGKNAAFNAIIQLATQGTSASSSVGGSFTSIKSSLVTQANSLTTQVAADTAASTSAATISGFNAAIQVALDDISAAEATLVTTYTDNQSSLETHLQGLFSSNCKANVVNVPILVKNGTGFYTGPSSGLVNAVQDYLDGIKDVTHEVLVVNGASLLVYADIDAKVSIKFGYVVSEILANLEFGIDALLKDRAFAAPLYLSDLYSVADQIEGISHVTIEITGPTTNLDALGNLIPTQLQIVTKGTVTITQV
jgi:hypothetical protein